MNQRLFKQTEYTVLKPHTDGGDVMKKVAALLTGYIRGTNPSKCLHKKFGGWANGNLWYDFAVHKSSLLTAHLSIDTER